MVFMPGNGMSTFPGRNLADISSFRKFLKATLGVSADTKYELMDIGVGS
jgi:hypothetical protein